MGPDSSYSLFNIKSEVESLTREEFVALGMNEMIDYLIQTKFSQIKVDIPSIYTTLMMDSSPLRQKYELSDIKNMFVNLAWTVIIKPDI